MASTLQQYETKDRTRVGELEEVARDHVRSARPNQERFASPERQRELRPQETYLRHGTY